VISRRGFVSGLAAVAATGLAACRSPGGVPGVLRIGFLANLTHAPMMNAVASGRLARALPGVRIEARTFRAGPRVVEALLGGAIDVGTTGPAPLVYAHARHGEDALRVLSGCASGGASLVVAPRVEEAADLRGAQLAVAQLGSTQDVSLRKWLRAHHLATKERGGDVRVTTLAPAALASAMASGEVAGGWLPEPWATRLVTESGARRLVDERNEWQNGLFAASLLAARADLVAARRSDVDRVVAALRAEIAAIATDPGAARATTHAEIGRLTGKGVPRKVLDAAWSYVDFTENPLAGAVERFAEDAALLGLVPPVTCAKLFTVA
jgi:NitT/TauT family transport system substrate-binding protein